MSTAYKSPRSLRHRITAAYVGLSLALCVAFAAVVEYARYQIDAYLVERRLDLVANWRLAGSLPDPSTLTPEIAFFRGDKVPPYLQHQALGFHEVRDGQRTLDALIGRLPSGEAYAAVDLVSDFERIEERVLLGLALCVVAATALALLLARMTAGRVLAPVTALAEAVRDDQLSGDSALLARRDEIGELARAFAARTEVLQQVLTRERLFTGDVSHELRTPLTVMLGAAEVLAVQLEPGSKQQAAVERIRRTAHNTAERVNALLLLSREPERLLAPLLALPPLIEREAERCKALLEGKPVHLQCRFEAAPRVYAQPELAEMAIGNLMRNACQYTTSGDVTVYLSAHQLEIEDSGPGLPADVQQHLFERLPHSSTPGGGAGLGLALAKRICEHLGWRISYAPRPEGGSRFLLEFPPSRR
ncbi:MAG TPA: HAMP domain-containing sensor histidine kinase [Burkholderiaceae bacterium]|jgi:signal transduction histidine kinase